ncbi:MAG: arginase, partial [Fimbriimonadaceae bacterium]|nr:arginase [Chitinophagales bacterium]
MEFDFLAPIDNDILNYIKRLSSQHLGSKIVLHTDEQVPDLNKIDIAIIGVLENRGEKNAVSNVDLSAIRKELYGMFPGNWKAAIADLGDILPGNSKDDTYFAVKKIVASLIKRKIIPI